MVAVFCVVVVIAVLLAALVEIVAGSGADPLPPARSPYPANAKLSRLVSRKVGIALPALASDPPRLVAGDKHKFSLLV